MNGEGASLNTKSCQYFILDDNKTGLHILTDFVLRMLNMFPFGMLKTNMTMEKIGLGFLKN